jgi:hypothetical protein
MYNEAGSGGRVTPRLRTRRLLPGEMEHLMQDIEMPEI